jgi:hypothetical protein
MTIKNVPSVKGNKVVKTLKTEKNMGFGSHKGDIRLHLCLMDDGNYHLRTVKYFKNGTKEMLLGERFSPKEKTKAFRIFRNYVKYSKRQ